MKFPHGLTEAEVLDAIERAVVLLAPSFVFGYYTRDDIAQEARIFGFQCLEKYDSRRPLPNFVYSHIKNRLINLKRDKLMRNDPPCEQCHAGSPCQGHSFCRCYQQWLDRNRAKANLMRPMDIDYIADKDEHRTKMDSTVPEDAEIQELMQLIDEKLPIDLRAPFLQMRAGVALPKTKREEVEAAVREILGCQNQDD